MVASSSSSLNPSFDPYGFLGRKLFEYDKAFTGVDPDYQQVFSKDFVNQLNQTEGAPFSMKGIDMTTGQSVDLNNYANLPYIAESEGGVKPKFENLPDTSKDISPGLQGISPDLQRQLDILDEGARRRARLNLETQRETALLEDELARGRFQYYLPEIQRLTEYTKAADLARQLGYEKMSPKVTGALRQAAQAGEAGMMQAIANQAIAARNLTGSFRGKNIAIG